MTQLILAIIALFLGPLLIQLVGERRSALRFLDGLILVSVGVLVLIGFLPHAVGIGGGWAAVAFVVGMALPSLVEKVRGGHHDHVHSAAVYVGMIALVLHAVTDGVAFADRGMAGQKALAIAVLLHRIPVGLAVWWLVRQTHGRRAALGVLAAIAAGTAIGYGVGVRLDLIHSAGFMIVLAFVAGSLMHVLLHQHGPVVSGARGRYRWPEFIGGVVGLAAIVIAGRIEAHELQHLHMLDGFVARLLHYGLESAPALLLGYVLAGLVVFFLPTASVNWLRGGRPIQQAGKGVLFGLPLPVCSCGVVPLYDSLVRAGVPSAAALAFLVATPELGIEAFILSFPLLGAELTFMRLGAALVLAFGVSLIVYRLAPERQKTGRMQMTNVDRTVPTLKRIVASLRYGLTEVLDDTAVWIVLGLGVAAAIAPDRLQPILTGVPDSLEILACALIGIPLYVCASGATPMAAALIAGGLSPGAAVTFLLSGPATNVTTFGVLSKLHSRKLALVFAVSVVGLATTLGLTVNALFYGQPYVSVEGAIQHGWGAWMALGILALAFIASVARQGPRAFVLTLFEFGSDNDDDASDCCDSSATSATSSCCATALDAGESGVK